MMAPVRRSSQLLGSVIYAMVYGLIHTAVIFVALVLFFPQLDLSVANPTTAITFMLLGSFSFVGIGMMAAILPLLYVERGAQMAFVFQSVLLLVSGVYYSIEVLPRLDAGARRSCRRRPTSSTASAPGLIERHAGERPAGHVWPLIVMGVVLIPLRAVGVRPSGALRQANRQAEASRLTWTRTRWSSKRSAGMPAGPKRSRRWRSTTLVPRGSSRSTARRRSCAMATGSTRPAAVSGRFRREAAAGSAFPAVGDWVVLEAAPVGSGPDDPAIVAAVLPRRSAFVRSAGRCEPARRGSRDRRAGDRRQHRYRVHRRGAR